MNHINCKNIFISAFAISLLVSLNTRAAANTELCEVVKSSDIRFQKKVMITWYVTAYKKFIGNCPCPYSIDYNDQLCGNQSEWSKPGVKTLNSWCYDTDIETWQITKFINNVACK